MTFMDILNKIDGFVWGMPIIILLVGTGIYLSCGLGFIQFTKIGFWWKNTIGKIFEKKEAGKGRESLFHRCYSAGRMLCGGRCDKSPVPIRLL